MRSTGKFKIVYEAGVKPGSQVHERVVVAGRVQRHETVLLIEHLGPKPQGLPVELPSFR